MRLSPALLLPLSLLVMLGAGCGQTPADTVSQGVINAGLQGQGSVKVDQNAIDYKAKNGDTMRSGENVQIPDDFPKDVPVYDGAKVLTVVHSASDDGASLTLSTADKPDAVVKWYDDKLKDWTKAGSQSYPGQEMRQYSKDGIDLILVIGGAAGQPTTITVSRTKSSQ